jgi:hypothetical protein
MKACSICKVEKPDTDFYLVKRRGREELASRCRPCAVQRTMMSRRKRHGASQCVVCGLEYHRQSKESRYCSYKCMHKERQVFQPPKIYCIRGHELQHTLRLAGRIMRCHACHIEREDKKRRLAGARIVDARQSGICVNGHPRTVENTRPGKKGGRRCRVCDRIRQSRLTGEHKTYASTISHDPCAYCGNPADSLDHIVPKAAGGTDTWDNFTSSCMRCNRVKSMKPLLRFLCERLPDSGEACTAMEIKLAPGAK